MHVNQTWTSVQRIKDGPRLQEEGVQPCQSSFVDPHVQMPMNYEQTPQLPYPLLSIPSQPVTTFLRRAIGHLPELLHRIVRLL